MQRDLPIKIMNMRRIRKQLHHLDKIMRTGSGSHLIPQLIQISPTDLRSGRDRRTHNIFLHRLVQLVIFDDGPPTIGIQIPQNLYAQQPIRDYKHLMRLVILFIALLASTQTMHLFHEVKGRIKKQVEKIKQPQTTNATYPVRFAYVNRIAQWWPPENIAAGIGVPGLAKSSLYNFFALSFWTYAHGPLDTALIWSDPLKYFGDASIFGNTKSEVQKALKKKYNDAGVKILVSAFGATEFPTTSKIDPIECATKLGTFVKDNNLDGVDIDWEDNPAMEIGKGQQWLISFQTKLRQLLPNHIISHAPQAPYFKQDHYKNGAYMAVHKAVGSTIDFYNIQFYNQGDTTYDTYEKLFLKSGGYFPGTSVNELIQQGIPSNKIVVGKPVTKQDAYNTGTVKTKDLGEWTARAYKQLKWYGGVMFWQYISDKNGNAIEQATGQLVKQCEADGICK